MENPDTSSRETSRKLPRIEDISEVARWQITTRILSLIPVLYDIRFREMIGEQYDILEQEIWVEVSRNLVDVGEGYHMPVSNAYEIACSLSVLAMVLFGPDLKFVVEKIEGDASVLTTKRCPYIARTLESGGSGPPLFGKCLSLVVPAISGLNQRYTGRYVRAMCMGDRGCEIKILTRDEAEKQEKKRPDHQDS